MPQGSPTEEHGPQTTESKSRRPDQPEPEPKTRRQRQLEERETDLERRSDGRRGSGLEDFQNPWMLAGGGLAAYAGLKRFGKFSGLFLMGIGGGMIYRVLSQNELLGGGFKRRLLQTKASETTHLRTTITVDLPVDAVYSKWRQLDNLAESMRHIEYAQPVDGDRDRWHFRARIPTLDFTVDWDAEIIEDTQNERLVWRSTQNADFHNEGQIEFRSRAANEQTEIHVDLLYHPPGGKAGRALGQFLRGMSEQVLREDVRRFKQYLETGVVPTTEGQSSGRQPSRPPQRS